MYDFFKDVFPDGERIPYKLMRWWFLDCYYTYCRSKIHHHSEWSKNEHEIAYAYEQQEFAYFNPTEQIMLEVLFLIFNAGRGPETVDPYHRGKIAKILEAHDLNEMLVALPEDERLEFKSDLQLLKILS
ncbi:hypothetical protein [Paraherbaspirillum soli]|uniref:Uncharacterized protein n=1 Tax=Paraherbaspirillum soli TaxID=631222 RepID=A0ABW0MEM1_9BURK